MSTGLVLEGGAMRGVYTGGVLDLLMDHQLLAPYVIGVSAGACNALSYLSGQRGRNKKINIGFAQDNRYLSYRNLLRCRSLFGMEFLFHEIPDHLVPFDWPAFDANPSQLVVVATDCHTAEPVYFTKAEHRNCIIDAVQASSSMPIASQPVRLNGMLLVDGGVADPIPLQKSIDDGNERNIVVLTRPAGYRKKANRLAGMAKAFYRDCPALIQLMKTRHELYNRQLELVEQLEREGRVIVIRPSCTFQLKRLERNPEVLTALYDCGYQDAAEKLPQLRDFLKGELAHDDHL